MAKGNLLPRGQVVISDAVFETDHLTPQKFHPCGDLFFPVTFGVLAALLVVEPGADALFLGGLLEFQDSLGHPATLVFFGAPAHEEAGVGVDVVGFEFAQELWHAGEELGGDGGGF